MNDLVRKRCKPCEGVLQPFLNHQAKERLSLIPGWSLGESGDTIQRVFSFKNFYETMAFVNAMAWIAHKEDHHPNLEVGYNRCTVHYSTHSIGGLSENDFICAAKINELLSTMVA